MMNPTLQVRLRHIVIAVTDLESTTREMETIFGIRVGYRDPAIAEFGLINAIFPVGGDFLELVQPIRSDSAAARFLARRGANAGYMVTFQVRDAHAMRSTTGMHDLRTIAEFAERSFVSYQFHPSDFAGILVSIDSVDGAEDWLNTDADWPGAGKDWRAARTDTAVGIEGITIAHPAPADAAKRWLAALGGAVSTEPDGIVRLDLTRGVVRFISSQTDAKGGVISRICLRVNDPSFVRDHAAGSGRLAPDGNVYVAGVGFDLATGGR